VQHRRQERIRHTVPGHVDQHDAGLVLAAREVFHEVGAAAVVGALDPAPPGRSAA
jgi:hypothetical protein